MAISMARIRGVSAAVLLGLTVTGCGYNNIPVAHMRDGRIADGFITAINVCENELAKHFPRIATNKDVRPDRIYLI